MGNEKALKVLLLEDNQDDAELILRSLRKDNLTFVSERVDTRQEYGDAIRRFQPDVVLSDHGLPQFNSKEALKICLSERPFVPFILVTGTMSDEFAISIMRDGADDYILKSNLSRLPSAIVRAIKERKLEKLKREARHALRRQNAELLKVNKELDNFVYSVSHNLRGPLSSVMGLLNLAKDEEDRKALESLMGMMETSIHALDETLKEILEFAKNARNEIQLGEIDWLSVIQSNVEKLEYLNEGNRIETLIHLKTDIPFSSDENRIGVILTSLLSNSIHYRHKTREAIIGIEVITTEEYASIVIKDNGIGIKVEVLPKVYGMFYRGTEESQGAGLGLYITKETAAKLKGHIEIESVYGEGTTVTVTIPNMKAFPPGGS